MGAVVQMWDESPTTITSSAKEEDIIRILKGIQNARYDTDKLVFDKSRSWADPAIIKL